MSGSVQRRIALAFVVLWIAAGVLAGAETVIVPLIDRAGACTYCGAATDAFDAAETSIDLLLSSATLDDHDLWVPVVAAHERGVRVRVLLDESEWAPSITERNRPAFEFLVERGIDARFDDPDVTTHAKLAIIDERIVLLGSTNWNHYAFYSHEQANVEIRDERVGAVFSDYFERIWTDRAIPGGASIDQAQVLSDLPTIVPLPDWDGTVLYGELLLPLLRRAERSIHVVMYRVSFYSGFADSLSNRLIEELAAAASRGLDVRVLIDDCHFYPDSAEANLTAAIHLYQRGVDVRFDEPEQTTHAKLVVIDGRSTVLGSTNWNYYALERNIEASVALLNMPEVAIVYDAYFETLWADGRRIAP